MAGRPKVLFRLNRLTDYAVVVLTQMARRPGTLTSAQQIADCGQLPLPTVAKLLNSLARAGIVASHRGAAGGYSLGRGATEITVADIVEALEGPIALTACVENAPDPCGVSSLCPMAGNWNKVNQAIHGALASVTLAEMSLPDTALGPPILQLGEKTA